MEETERLPDPPEREIADLLSELSKSPQDPVPLFKKLEEITGLTPYAEGHAGKYKRMIDDWVLWGRETGLLPEEPEEYPPTPGDPLSVNPLIDVLERIDSRLTALEEKQEEIGEGFKRLMGILNMLATNLSDAKRPWGDRTPLPEREDFPSEVRDPEPAIPGSSVPRRPPPPPSPALMRGGRVYS